uniref:Putative transcriptional regulator DEF1 isoform X1 n=1 Tax=Davidia involucrata TaxID=16924 RepID=A0A5B6ZB85_DAVIN
MNTSQFMDKQIMDLSNSLSNSDFIDLMNGKKEEIMSSYDSQPIRPIGASQPPNLDPSNVGGTRVWNSADMKTNATDIGISNYGSLDSVEPAKVILEKDHNVIDAALVSEIDRTMKNHADNLFHALEGVSARLSQLESRTRHLENSVDDLKVSVGNNHGSTDGGMRQLENILREVQSGVQVIRDKQEIVEAQLQLAKLQVSKVEPQSETQNTAHVDSVQQAASAPQQSHQQLPPVAIIQPPSGLPPPTSQQNLPPPVLLQNQFPQNQIPSVPQRESYFLPPGQTQEATNQQFQLPPPPAPQQQYQPPPHPQYSQPPPPPQQHPSLSAVNPPQPQPSLGHHSEETPYMPSQNYPPSLRQPPSHPSSGASPSQQFYGTPSHSHMYEPPSNRPSSGFSSAYGPSSGPSEPYPYGGSPSQYGSGSTMKPQQLSSPAMAQSGGSGYPQLPTARILPPSLPTASGVGSGSGSAGTGNRVPIDDVIDKVTNMGFSRDQVRATVRKLTENGQSVDLNVVLDKLMNGGEGQPQRGWFGR